MGLDLGEQATGLRAILPRHLLEGDPGPEAVKAFADQKVATLKKEGKSSAGIKEALKEISELLDEAEAKGTKLSSKQEAGKANPGAMREFHEPLPNDNIDFLHDKVYKDSINP